MSETDSLADRPVVLVREFRFEGNTVFTDEELAAEVADFVGKELATEQLLEVRQKITLKYVSAGYINSGAVLPDQRVDEGIVTYQIIEGSLTRVNVTGQEWFTPSFIESRARRGADTPLNVIELKEAMEVLRQNRNIQRVNAELKPGDKPGEAWLDVDITEASPYYLALQFVNDRTPSVGAERLYLLAAHHNVTGHGDDISVRWGLIRRGVEETALSQAESTVEFGEADDLTVDYSLPFTDEDSTFHFGYTRSDSLLIEDPFIDVLRIGSESESFSVGVRHPFYRTPTTEFAMALFGENRTNQTTLVVDKLPLIDDDPSFSFEPGAEQGDTEVAVLRFSQELVTRSQQRVIALRSTFSFGIDAMGATEQHDDTADGQFVSWLGQAQYVQRLFDTQNQVLLRATTQIADDSLLALEQFAIGGRYTVRGYRENQLVRDNAVVASLEFRLPLWLDEHARPRLELAPFVDYGLGWDSRSPYESQNIGSAGLGLLLHLFNRLDAELYWGHPFRNIDNLGHDLQDDGIHFNVVLRIL